MKSYIELVQEVLDQRAIVDNRNIVDLTETSKSVLVAFNQACEFMLNLHQWKWNNKEETYLNDLGQNTFPMPYGIVRKVLYKKGSNGEKCELDFVPELYATEGCPSQWTNKWDTEEIQIAPAVSKDCDEVSQTIIKYNDKNIACIGSRTDGVLIPRFTLESETSKQFLNVPEHVYDAYARCIILKTRVFLNEGAQATVFQAQKEEWAEAYNGLMSFAKTPLYSERTEI
jgi:hypothetical protein